MLILATVGVYLLAGLGWSLITAAGLLFIDLLSDMLTERTPADGRTDRPPRT